MVLLLLFLLVLCSMIKSVPVKHIIARSRTSISNLVSNDLQIDLESARHLIHLGAVYLKSAGSEATRKASRVMRNEGETIIDCGDYLRVHPKPKRYDTESIDWKSCILQEESDFVVIKKPAGFPTQPSIDNYSENVAKAMQDVLQCDSMFTLHRLDVDTEGLMVLGKTFEFASHFNSLIRRRENGVKRRYVIVRGLIYSFLERTILYTVVVIFHI